MEWMMFTARVNTTAARRTGERCPSNRPFPIRRGFTLIEAAIVTVIVGVGVVGLVQLLGAGTMANVQSSEITTAVYLGNNINEMIQGAVYSGIKATYDNKTYSPPVDGCGSTISGLSGWSQVVTVQYVDPNLLTLVVGATQVEPTSLVTAKVIHNGSTVYTAKWIVAAPQ